MPAGQLLGEKPWSRVLLMASKQWKRSNRHPQRRLRLIDREASVTHLGPQPPIWEDDGTGTWPRRLPGRDRTIEGFDAAVYLDGIHAADGAVTWVAIRSRRGPARDDVRAGASARRVPAQRGRRTRPEPERTAARLI